MRRHVIATVIVSVLLVLAAPLGADCPAVFNVDDPPCTPCPYIWTGWWAGAADYEDGSALYVSGDILTNCDGDHRYTYIAVSYWCPNGPDDEQCIARQRYFAP